MRFAFYWLIVVSWCFPFLSFAQISEHDLFRMISGEGRVTASAEMQVERWEVLQEVLSEPYDINLVSEQDLKQLGFLTDFEIFCILKYRRKYGRVLDIRELDLVSGLDEESAYLLSFFITAGNNGVRDEFNHQKSIKAQVFNRYKHQWPHSSSFTKVDSASPVFPGPPVYRYLKAEVEFGEKWYVGIALESDAGEPSVIKNGFDFHSVSLCYDNPKGKIRKVIAGNFRVYSGHGLVSGNPFYSKNSSALIPLPTENLRKTVSASEALFNRGIAIEINKGKYSAKSYFSYVPISVNTDTFAGISYISTIYSSGLYRTDGERAKKYGHSYIESGAIQSFRSDNAGIIHTIIHRKYDMPVRISEFGDPAVDLGKYGRFFNHSLSGYLKFDKLFVSGEFSMDGQYNNALFVNIQKRVHPLLSTCISFRYYAPEYKSWNASCLSGKTDCNNEIGFYFGMDCYPIRELKLSVGYDQFSSPNVKFGKIDEGKEYELSLRGQWIVNPDFKVISLFRLENYYQWNTYSQKIPGSAMRKRERYMIQTEYKANSIVSLSNKLEMKRSGIKHETSNGIFICQEARFAFPGNRLLTIFRYSIFDIPDWENRIYSYEPDVYQVFSLPAYSGKGESYLVKCAINCPPFKMEAKYALINYHNITEKGNSVDYRKAKCFHYFNWQIIYKMHFRPKSRSSVSDMM